MAIVRTILIESLDDLADHFEDLARELREQAALYSSQRAKNDAELQAATFDRAAAVTRTAELRS